MMTDLYLQHCGGTIVGSKIRLGLLGAILVAVSVVTALGLLSYIGVKASPVTFELIPFLLLAVGTDHLFILADAYRVSNIAQK